MNKNIGSVPGLAALFSIALVVACTVDSSVATTEEGRGEENSLSVITFDSPIDARAVADFAQQHDVNYVAAYAYAEHDDGQIGTLITRSAPDELEETLGLVESVEGAEFLGVGAIVIDADVEKLTELARAHGVLSVGPAVIHLGTDGGEAPTDAWSVLRGLGYVEE